MKRIVDQRALEGEDNSDMYWLTDSQKFHMMQGVGEALAGRVAIFEMAGLSTAEKEGRPPSIFKADIESLRARLSQSTEKDIHELYSLIFNGSMPRLFAKALDRSQCYMNYINTYLERDIQQLTNVGKSLDQTPETILYGHWSGDLPNPMAERRDS